MTARSLRYLLLSSLLMALVAACGGDPDGDGPGADAVVASVSVTPASNETFEGKSLQLKATPQTKGGKAITGKQVEWSSSDVLIATVDETGLVSTLLPGEVKIRATVDGVEGEATIEVRRNEVASVEILPATNVTSVGRELQLEAVATDADGAVIGGRAVVWESSDASIVSVDATGLATAHAVGDVTITATIAPASGTLELSVREPVVDRIAIIPESFDVIEGQTTELEAKVYDADGFEVEWPVEWSSEDRLHATVDSSGRVTGGLAGDALIRASADGHEATALGRVTAAVVSGVRIVGTNPIIPIGDVTRVGASAIDEFGTPLDRRLTWSVEDETVATVDGQGNVTGLSLGTTRLTARFAETIEASVPLVPVVRTTAIAAGRSHTCGLTPRGKAICFGLNDQLQLGTEAIAERSFTPVAVQMPSDLSFTEIAAGGNHSCALTFSGDVWCWGSNSSGQLGTAPSTTRSASPVKVTRPAGVKFVSLSLGGEHSCALAEGSQAAFCWGNSDGGRLGIGSSAGPVPNPAKVGGEFADYKFIALSAGLEHSCGLVVGGTPYCWGSNAKKQIAPSGTTFVSPVDVDGDANPFEYVSVAAGNDHTCIVRKEGQIRCWGGNAYGQLGNGSTSPEQAAMQDVATTTRFARVVAGRGFTCGLTETGLAHCWGANGFLQLGRDSGDTTRPATVNSSATFRTISAGETHVCAMTPTPDRAFCWGQSNSGQLGQISPKPRPERVDGQD